MDTNDLSFDRSQCQQSNDTRFIARNSVCAILGAKIIHTSNRMLLAPPQTRLTTYLPNPVSHSHIDISKDRVEACYTFQEKITTQMHRVDARHEFPFRP